MQDLSATEKGKLQDYYVRIRYNDRPVVVEGCKPAGNHLEGDESFCTLVSFRLTAPHGLLSLSLSIADIQLITDCFQGCRRQVHSKQLEASLPLKSGSAAVPLKDRTSWLMALTRNIDTTRSIDRLSNHKHSVF